VPLYFNLVGTVAHIEETTPDNPLHPSPVLLLDTVERIERVVLSGSAWSGPHPLRR
jgi:hypothetical protein